MEREHLSDLFEKLAHRHRVPGAQLTVYRDGGLHEMTYGVERSGTTRPVSPRSRFAFGSVSKVFTAALIMQLVEEGEVDLDEPVPAYLATHRIAQGHPMHTVTLRHLLSHTAGLVSDHEGEPLRSASLRRYFASVLGTEQLLRPGTAFSYSNTGYAVAAYIVEAVTGQDWWETLGSYLARPAGLDLAFIHDARFPSAVADTVSGHAVHAATGQVTPIDFYVESTLAAAGGIAGSATDLVAFARAFMGDDDTVPGTAIAGPDVLAEMGRSVTGADPFGLADGWGAGWGIFHADGTRWLGHDGTLDGGTCNVRFDPIGGAAVALTTNATSGLQLWEELVVELRNAGLRIGHYCQPAPVGAAAGVGEQVTGDYTNGDLSISVTSDSTGALRFGVSNGFVGVLDADPDLTFSVTSAERDQPLFSGRFLRAAGVFGPIESMQYNGRTLRRAAVARHLAA
ncbi:serine hydrolase domain-containing protein [Nocardiopsis ansamitocini]|uniref:Serine hydrolase n=1 Tax=Nocardiopsis ansamitocini TaxID=1670832 RepID=A0A9W6P7V7_9ACTN|nr:serine hydrolase domain-containing protein [Nocardiopsis ansamitocini]GLU49124.1 serine hydrolase [Nocardiopsis ansamitocini]